MATTGDELILQARTRASAIAPKSLPSLDALRLEAKALFEALPEPPAYQRREDPTPEQARRQIEPALDLFARILTLADATRRVTTITPTGTSKPLDYKPKSCSDAEFQSALSALVQAMELHLRALAALSAGLIVEGDLLVSEARVSARQALREGILFRFVGENALPPVYDPVSGISRYDARPVELFKVQLTCMGSRCRKRIQFTLPAQTAFHRLACPHCTQSFSVLFGHNLLMNSVAHGITNHYELRFRLLGEDTRLLEFDDASQHPLTIIPGDFLALLYSCTGALAAIENLSTGKLHKVVPKGACFVATMAFGENAAELKAFRDFRDEHLMHHPWGRAFVRAYYRHGSALADLLSRSALTKQAVRWSLVKVHAWLARSASTSVNERQP